MNGPQFPFDKRQASYAALLAPFATWHWNKREELAGAGLTRSQIRTTLREFDRALSGIMLLVLDGRYIEVDRRLDVMRAVVRALDGLSPDGQPEAVLQ